MESADTAALIARLLARSRNPDALTFDIEGNRALMKEAADAVESQAARLAEQMPRDEEWRRIGDAVCDTRENLKRERDELAARLTAAENRADHHARIAVAAQQQARDAEAEARDLSARLGGATEALETIAKWPSATHAEHLRSVARAALAAVRETTMEEKT